jgi:hypothetical protein
LNHKSGDRFSHVQTFPDCLWGPPSFLFKGYHHLFPGVKLLEHDIDPLLPSGAEVKNEWSYSSAHPVRNWGMGMDSVAFNLATGQNLFI